LQLCSLCLGFKTGRGGSNDGGGDVSLSITQVCKRCRPSTWGHVATFIRLNDWTSAAGLRESNTWLNARVSEEKESASRMTTWRDSVSFSVGCGVALVGFYILLTIGHYYNEGWGPNQWGPVAAWMGSLLTAAAVSVSLYQTKLARDDAAKAKLDAAAQIARDEKRHTDQLAAANDRLTNELDAQRKARQVEALYHVYRDEQTLESVYDALLLAIEDAREINNRENERQKKVSRLLDGFRGDRANYRASMAEVNFIVSDVASRKILKKMQDLEEILNDRVEASATRVTTEFVFDLGTMSLAKKEVSELVELREALIAAARELSGVIPLDRVTNDDAGQDPARK
jgi:hypothetical protein